MATRKQTIAQLFAALGDKTRLTIVGTLAHGKQLSISELSKDSAISRQAVTRHLRVLEKAGLIQSTRDGRENLFQYKPEAVDAIKDYLENISFRWNCAFWRLKEYVEKENL